MRRRLRELVSVAFLVNSAFFGALALALASPSLGSESVPGGVTPETLDEYLPRLQSAFRQFQQSGDKSPEELIARYEEAAQRFSSDPLIGLALLDLANLYSMNNDSHANPRNDSLEMAIDKYRKARKVSTRGNSLWTEASLGLANQLRRRESGIYSLPEARQIMDEVQQCSLSIPGIHLRLKEHSVLQLVAEGKFNAAESDCRSLLSLGSQMGVAGEKDGSSQLLRRCQQVAASSLLNGILRSRDPDRSSVEWFDQFAADFPQHLFLQEAVAVFRDQLPFATQRPVVASRHPRRLLIAINLALVAFVFLLAGRPGWKRLRFVQTSSL